MQCGGSLLDSPSASPIGVFAYKMEDFKPLIPIGMMATGAYLIGGPINAGWTLALAGAIWLFLWLMGLLLG